MYSNVHMTPQFYPRCRNLTQLKKFTISAYFLCNIDIKISPLSSFQITPFEVFTFVLLNLPHVNILYLSNDTEYERYHPPQITYGVIKDKVAV